MNNPRTNDNTAQLVSDNGEKTR